MTARKRCIGLAIALTMVFGSLTAGWAGGKTDTANKIIIFQSKVEITDQMEAAAKAYKAETGVDIEIWTTTGDSYWENFKTRLANNQGPTIFSASPGTRINEIAPYLEDLSDLAFTRDIPADLLPKVSGKTVGIPYTVEGFGFVYNKNMVNRSQMKDFDSFENYLKESKAKGINGFGLSQESYFLIGHILNAPFSVMPDMPGFMDRLNKGQVKLADTKEFQEFARFYAAIRDNSYNPLEVKYDKECGDFATGKTAAIHQGNWAYGMFDDYKMDFEMGILPFPLGGNDKLAVSVPNCWAINSQAPANQKKLAKDFITWLYTSQTGRRFLMDEFRFIPVVKGMTSSKLDPLSAEVARYTAENKTLPWATSLYPVGIVNTYLVPLAQRFFTSKMTPQEFLAGLDEAWAKSNGR